MPLDDIVSNSAPSTQLDSAQPVRPAADSSAPAPQFQTPTPTQPLPANGAQVPSANSPGNTQQIVSNAQPAQDPNANHPLVKRASIIKSVAATLAGGDRYKIETDVNTGEVKKVPVPLSGREIAMAIALEAISGSLAGLAAGRGHGAGAAGLAGMNAGGKIVQQRRDQENQDQQLAEQNLARHYQVAEANMRMLSLAQTMGRMDQEQHENMVRMSADQLKYLKENTPELIGNERVSEAEAKDLNKYPLNEYTRIPDGVTPRLDANGNPVFIDAAGKPVPEGTPGSHPAMDNTYSLVHKNAKIGLVTDGAPAEFVKQAVDWGLLDKSWIKAAPGSEMSAPLAATISRKVDSLNAAHSDLTRYYVALNASTSKGHAKPGEFSTPKYPPVDLRTEIGKDPTLATALDKFQGIFNQTGSREAAIGELAKKDPRAAGKVARLYGGRDALHDFDMQQKLGDLKMVNNAELDKERSLIPIKAATAAAEARARAAATAASSRNEDGSWNMGSIPVALVEGNMDPSQLSKRSADYNQKLQDANAYSLQKYGKPFDIAQAATDYKQANNPQVQSMLKMVGAMSAPNGELAIAVNAAKALPQMNSSLLNKVFNITETQFGSDAATNFHTAMIGFSDLYAKVMGGGVGTDALRQSAMDVLKDGYSHGQIAGSIKVLQQQIEARRDQMIGNNPYLRKQFGGSSPAGGNNTQSPPVSLLKEGVNTTFQNGQTWTLQNGQPVQVK